MIGISKVVRMWPAVILCFGAARAESQTFVAGSVNAGSVVTLREGIPLVLAFTGSLSSRTAVKGAPVSFVLVNDVSVDGVTVAKAGCKALGQVTYARGAAIPGRSGALGLQLNYLELGDRKVKLRASKERSGESGIQYSRPYRLKWPMGLLRTGDDIEIKQGTVLAVFVAEDISL